MRPAVLTESVWMTGQSQAPVSGSHRKRAPKGSDFGVFGKSKRVLYVDPEITHRILDLAVAEKDLDSP